MSTFIVAIAILVFCLHLARKIVPVRGSTGGFVSALHLGYRAMRWLLAGTVGLLVPRDAITCSACGTSFPTLGIVTCTTCGCRERRRFAARCTCGAVTEFVNCPECGLSVRFPLAGLHRQLQGERQPRINARRNP